MAGVALLALLLSGFNLYLREFAAMPASLLPFGLEEAGTVAFFAIVLSILLHLVELPFAFYQGFLLEHRYGLSNQSLAAWASDQVKAGGVAIVLATLGATVAYASLRWFGHRWWVVSASVFALATIVLARIAPVILLPLFYRFKRLERPVLVERLLALAQRARTEVLGVFEWSLSAHTKKANAALAGMGRTRRILISDTLLADYSDDEIEVILAHELSHHVHHDLWRAVALQTALLFGAFYAAHLALLGFADSLALRGVDDPAGLPLLLLVGGTSSLLFLPVANAMSRLQERRADRYALELTRQPAAFISAMKRLSQQNLAEEHPSALVQSLFYSHPPIRDRIAFARRWQHQQGGPGAKLGASIELV